jgi:hypothetical protein
MNQEKGVAARDRTVTEALLRDLLMVLDYPVLMRYLQGSSGGDFRCVSIFQLVAVGNHV